MVDSDSFEYFKYTGPMRLDKAIHSLSGLLKGIASDKHVTDAEIRYLRNWLLEHEDLAARHPFDELTEAVEEILDDDKVDADELEDLRWLTQRLDLHEGFFSADTHDLQQLHAIATGIASDGVVNRQELAFLQEWVEEHQHLRTRWPYDEIDALLTAVLADGRIDPEEHQLLLRFLSEFGLFADHKSLSLPLNEVNTPITGLCAVCPEIEFADRAFCFTGKSQRLSRHALAAHVEERGGKFIPSVTRDVHYLVIGGDGNPCWAYACYGRKVEQALTLRKNGHSILLVHEYDYWDACA